MTPPPKGKSAAKERRSGRPAQSPAVRRALRRGAASHTPRLVLGPLNWGLLAAGAVAIVVGFVLLGMREKSLSPILLVLGYCVLVPAGLVIQRRPGRGGEEPRPGGGPGGE